MNKISNDNNLLKYFTMENLQSIYRISDLHFRAKLIVTFVFQDKVDQAGNPYIGHLIRVSERLLHPIERIAGLLHDILEDTEITEKDLIEIGIPDEVIEVVKLVTHEKIDRSNMTKEEKLALYNSDIDKIINSGNIHAIRLKEADMSDNYDETRLKELSQEKQEWFHEKYGKQLVKLRKVKGEMDI